MTGGALRVDGDEPVATATMFRLMSMTKPLGSVGAPQLVEQSKLELDQEVASVLPKFGELQVLEGFDGDKPRLREPNRQATIRNLLTPHLGVRVRLLQREPAALPRADRAAGSAQRAACARTSKPHSWRSPAPSGTTASASTGSGR